MPEIELEPHEYRANSKWGEALDFGHSATVKKRKDANPLIWGAWGGIAASILAFVAWSVGQPMHQTIWGAGMAGFFWLWVVAQIWNWLGKRRVTARR